MGRKGSILIPFLTDALFSGKYINLQFEPNTTNTFSLNLPRKSSSMGKGCQLILKDWYHLTNKKYKFFENYTKAKQAMESSLRKSDYLEELPRQNTKLIYRLLEVEEIKAKKLLKKAAKNKLKRDSPENTDEAPSSVQSSGYGSGEDSPLPCNSDESYSDHALTHAVKHAENNYAFPRALAHDHDYLIQTTNITYPRTIEPNNSESGSLPIYFPATESEGLCPAVLDIAKEDLNFENEGLHAEDEGLFNPNVLSVSQMEIDHVCLNSENVNAPLANVEGGSNILNDSYYNNFYATLSDEDACMQDQLFHIDNFLIPGSEKLEELLKNESILDDIEGHQNYLAKMKSSTIDPPSFKTQKVFQCVYCQQIPGMVLLTFQSKLMEFPKVDSKGNEPDSKRFIFDEATLQVISSCILVEEKVLSKEHMLLIFKCIG